MAHPVDSLTQTTPSRIILFVLDGLGGLPYPETGRTELETARKPNLDRLARRSICGLMQPVGPGITPGSGSAHLSLFGYDPWEHPVGRGVLEALGIDFPLQKGDLTARGNFCTVDGQGMVVDRRAGRLPTEQAAGLCQRLGHIRLNGAQVLVAPVKEHRFLVVFRGEGLSPDLSDSDPQQEGRTPLEIRATSPQAQGTATLVQQFVAQARELLAASHPANMVLLRGFSYVPQWPSLAQRYNLRPAAVAPYPMYRGLARLLGMTVLDTGPTLKEEVACLARHYQDYDFFYLHYKETDRCGEDGDFAGKVRAIEEADTVIPDLLALSPAVLVVTGDHSTPAVMKGHSWHPVPFLLYSPWARPDGVTEFSERACRRGGLGLFPALEVMPQVLAHALKLAKFGA